MNPAVTAASPQTGAPSAAGNPALAELIDIQLPDEIGLWPLAWGWWLLAIALVLVLTWALRRLIRHRRFWRVRKLALKQLRSAGQAPTIADSNRLLKQVALHYFHPVPDANAPSVAALQGADWCRFLSRLHPGLDASQLQLLLMSSYQANSDSALVAKQSQQFSQLAIDWLNALSMKKINDIQHNSLLPIRERRDHA